MTDFEITFQADELLYGNYKKMSLISEIMFRKFSIIETQAPLPP